MSSLNQSGFGNLNGKPDRPAQEPDLKQAYRLIGAQYEQIQAQLNLVLLDPTARLDPETTFRLAAITAFQFSESLCDSAAADATLLRDDWRSALHLPLKHPGFNASLICRYREALSSSWQALQSFSVLLDILETFDLFPGESGFHLDPLEVITTVCQLTRFAYLQDAMKTALSVMVSNHPDWLRKNALPHWYERYKTGRVTFSSQINPRDMHEEAVRLGKDIHYLISAIDEQSLATLKEQKEIQKISCLLKDEFLLAGDHIQWQKPACQSCACSRRNPVRFSYGH